MIEERLIVRRVRGRYPAEAECHLCSDNIEVQIEEVGRFFCIRLDDMEQPEVWLEILLEVQCDA